MSDHHVAGYLAAVSLNLQIEHLYPRCHVVILPSPAPEFVGEPIQHPELFGVDGDDPTKEVTVGKLVVPLTDSHGHVTRVAGGTGVEVPVVLGQQVHVVEYEAIPGKVLQRLHKSDIDEFAPVKPLAVSLSDDVDPVVQVLPLEEGVDVVEEDQELARPVPEGNDERHAVPGPAGLRSPLPAPLHPRVPPDQLRQSEDQVGHHHPALEALRHCGAGALAGGTILL